MTTDMILTIEQTADTLKKWIESCETSEQLQLCREAVCHFLEERFLYSKEKAKIDEAKTDLYLLIDQKEVNMMTDSSRMPFGKYKNDKMANVPASYLIWIYENGHVYGDVKKYIEDNMETLKEEIELEKKKQN